VPACLQQQHRLQVLADVLPDVTRQPGSILQSIMPAYQSQLGTCMPLWGAPNKAIDVLI
jgi:hypothetical protein